MSSEQTSGGRLRSLDVFRGATIAGMMLVNNPGNWDHVYAPFRHAAWHGWTYTDTIFPFFLWIVGVAMTFSFAKRMERGDSRGVLALHIVRRSAIIFALGLFLSGFPFGLFGHTFDLSTLRIPGVLQRIALCTLAAGFVLLRTSPRQQGLVILSLLTAYWIALMTVPVPGYGSGVLDPQGNLGWWIDSRLLAGHTWSHAPAPGFDPEGILSTIPAIATTLFGVLTGNLLRSDKSAESKTALMFVYGNLLILAGLVMDNWLPINKNLWTSSYTVFMAGLALNVLAVCYWIIDVRGRAAWSRPFEIYGLNAVTVFVLAGMIARLTTVARIPGDGDSISIKSWYDQFLFGSIPDPMMASFLHSLLYVFGLYAIAYLLFKNRVIIRI